MSHSDSRSATLHGFWPRLGRAFCRLSRIFVPKSLYRIDDDFQVPRRAPRVNKVAVCIFLGFVTFPVVVEAISAWIAQWFTVMGKPLIVQTPLLDFSRGKLVECCDELASWAACQFDGANLSPRTMLPIALLLLVLAARMLKK